MLGRLVAYADSLAQKGVLPTDSETERFQKILLARMILFTSWLGLPLGLTYGLLGQWQAGLLPAAYSLLSGIGFVVYCRTQQYPAFRTFQLLLVLCFPFLEQASLGGFAASGAVMLWALLAPLSALMTPATGSTPKRWWGEYPWCLTFGGFAAVAAAADPYLVRQVLPLPPAVISAFFAVNVVSVGALSFSIVRAIMGKNREVFDKLLREHDSLVLAKETIEDQAKRLIELDQTKSRFFANISHEFRTPLTLTIGPLEDMLAGIAGPVSDPQRRQLDVMLRNSRLLLRLINQLLDLAKAESGAMPLHPRQGNLGPFLDGIVRSFQPFADRKQVALQLRKPPDGLPWVFDVEKLEKVFYNLLSNALKFTPTGGKITVVLQQPGDSAVEITVKDSGIGIPTRELPHIFDRFHQVDDSATRDQEGSGIGLALTRELVALHGGEIQVSSTVGFGTEFRVRLPVLLQTPAESGPASPAEGGFRHAGELPGGEVPATVLPAAPVGEGPTILVVDDNADIRGYVADSLAATYRVLQACNGEEGLHLARAERPDLVISDVMMPLMDGYDLCRAIKADAELGHLPVILLTAKASEDMRIEGLEAGADDYVSKPFNARELRARVRNLIAIRQQEVALKGLNEGLEIRVRSQLEQILNAKRLTRYFSKNMLDRILSEDDGAELVAERRNLTLFFSDLTGFTDLSDRTEPERITRVLNDYLGTMLALVEAHGATLDKVMGDGIMAFFGAPAAMEPAEQARRAVAMAVAMQHQMAVLGQRWREEGLDHQIQIRIGIHQDFVTIGNFGSDQLMDYTAIGNGVNLASRLESSCEPGKVKVSFPIYTQTRDQFPYGDLVEERFKGFARPIRVTELDPAAIP